MFSFQRSLISIVGLLVIVGAPLVSRGQGDIKNPLNRDPRKSYYLTKTFHNGSQAPSACADGYHMASLWEILDPSNLKYDTQLGITRDDSGFGPPAGSEGWIRTGSDAGSITAFSLGNCYAWTSTSNTDVGAVVFLTSVWTSTNVLVISPWGVGGSVCSNSKSVWCMQD